MALGTYTELQTAIANELNRDDLKTAIPDFIRLAEARIRRIVRTRDTVKTSLSLVTATTALPVNVKEVRSLYLNDSVEKGALEIVTPERLQYHRRRLSPTGVPRFASLIDGSVVVVPTPQATYAAEIVYDQEWTPLSTTSTNWLLSNHPDLYFYGALVESAPFLRDDQRMPMWDSRFQSIVAELEVARDRYEWGANTPVQRPRRALG